MVELNGPQEHRTVPPAARITDMHTCPAFTGPVPHVGGPILPPAAPTVLINFLPAARLTDMAVCVGPPDVIVKGSAGVLINFLPAARMGDSTAHGGVIILGSPNVIIGEVGSPSPGLAGLAAIATGLAATGHSNPAAHQSAYSKAHHRSPCSGKGLGRKSREKAFAKSMKALQKDWKTLNPAQRQQRLKDAVNAQLSKSGVPTVGVTPNPAMGSDDGQMNFQSWRLDVRPSLLSSPDLTNEETQALGDTLYHESRHAEQWYLIARRKAAEGQTAAQIQHSTAMLQSTANAAAAHPLPKHHPMARCAAKMDASVYGSGATHRDKVLTALEPTEKNYTDASAKYDALNIDPTATLQQKQAAWANLQAAQHTYTTNYNMYRALPEEADAWHTGDSVGQLLKP